MASQPRIVIVDRSQLAGNMYRLLLSPLEPAIALFRRFEDARPRLAGRERCDLALISAQTFGKRSEEICAALEQEEALRRLRKLFLVSEGEEGMALRERLGRLPNAAIVARPFHPDELLALIRRELEVLR